MIGFNQPYLTGREIEYISEAHSRGQLAGDGYFTKKCSEWLEINTGCHKALLTHSCTAALEMAAILADIQPGDEVIMPSYTFVSTANAFVLRGGVPIFIDIREDTLNINESLIEDAITSRTKVIVPVHYAGVACEMDLIMDIAQRYNLLVVEDAAQGIMATYKGRPLGSIGDLGCYSFHETKNIISGEGGALLVNNPSLIKRAEIIREKGTNRAQFSRGSVDKYSWVDLGSSYLPGELTAAFLWAQLEAAESITANRHSIWKHYNESLADLELAGYLRRPALPSYSCCNAHMYYILLNCEKERASFIARMKEFDVHCVFHYVPLHTSLFARRLGLVVGDLPFTKDLSRRIVRLPFWIGIEPRINEIVSRATSIIQNF